jgi:hypothetical protein
MNRLNDKFKKPVSTPVLVLGLAAGGSLLPLAVTLVVGGIFEPWLVPAPLALVPLAVLALVLRDKPAKSPEEE